MVKQPNSMYATAQGTYMDSIEPVKRTFFFCLVVLFARSFVRFVTYALVGMHICKFLHTAVNITVRQLVAYPQSVSLSVRLSDQ